MGGGGVGGGGPSNGLMGMSLWMGSHLHDWFDYNDLQQGCVFNRVTPRLSQSSSLLISGFGNIENLPLALRVREKI